MTKIQIIIVIELCLSVLAASVVVVAAAVVAAAAAVVVVAVVVEIEETVDGETVEGGLSLLLHHVNIVSLCVFVHAKSVFADSIAFLPLSATDPRILELSVINFSSCNI